MAKSDKNATPSSVVPPKVDDSIFENLPTIFANAAGIDIGSETHYVSVADDRDEVPTRTFGCYTPDLEALAAWLKQCRITTVVMESTGVYWVPVYSVLEQAGLEVRLVDANHAKNVPGRKTDVWDCRWLRKLHTFGLLNGCFIPPAQVSELRSYWRHRANLVESCSQQILRMHKALELMNLHLHKALSDILGVTGMRIVRAIVGGEHDAKRLSMMRDQRVKATEETLVKALTGNYRPEHLFILKQALESYDFLHVQMEACDKEICQCMARFEDKVTPVEPRSDTGESARTFRRKNEPYFDATPELKRIFGVDLMRINGISTITALTVLSEVGPDLSAFPTAGRFCSWLGLCPNHRITGGRVLRNNTRKVSNPLSKAFRIAAQSLHHSNCALGAFFRRISLRRGMPKAITATAHKLAKLVYMMLTHGTEYVEQGQAAYETQYKERCLKAVQKQAAALGFALVPAAT